VDAPETAVTEADHLLVLVMGERGYPTEGYEQQVSDLSVEHATTIDRYRKAHDISSRAEAEKASTEDLRQAMVHYRALFTELLDTDEEAVTNGRGTDGAVTEPEPVAETDAGTEPAAEARADAAAAEPVAEPVDEPAAAEPVAADRTETAERDATQADADARDEATGERAKAETRARTRTGRRTARRDSDDEGA
jgi:hypothetical protein